MPEDLEKLKPQVYKDPRPAEYFTRYHERARQRDPDWMYETVRMILTPLNYLAYRSWAIDADKVPKSGPVILAPNHFSNLDHFFLAMFLKRKVRFVAKSQLFVPGIQEVFYHGGVIPVRRGHNDQEMFTTVETVLERGGLIAMYAEGGRSRSGKLGERLRPGLGRIALQSGAAVVPVAIYGSARLRNWKRLEIPKVTVQYGDPLRFDPIAHPTREQADRATATVFAEVRKLYEGLDRYGRRGAVKRARAARRERARAAVSQ
jgi:1-acyl-sn-glycerol-3-phosphate acyltransferase